MEKSKIVYELCLTLAAIQCSGLRNEKDQFTPEGYPVATRVADMLIQAFEVDAKLVGQYLTITSTRNCDWEIWAHHCARSLV